MIYLTNGKKDICRECKIQLVKRTKTFLIYSNSSKEPKEVTEELLFCDNCKRFYVSQLLATHLAKKYTGFHVDAHTYIVKHKPKRKNNSDIMKKESGGGKIEHYVVTREHPSNIPIIVSNVYNVKNNTCPNCCSVLAYQKANIPVVHKNGDFYRYYAREVLYCHHCKKGYLTSKMVESLLDQWFATVSQGCSVSFENVVVRQKDNSYLYYPSLDSDVPTVVPDYDYTETYDDRNDEFSYKTVSFLGEMGYSVQLNMQARHQILSGAVAKYGKRRVCDHIAFLIDNRRKQHNGAEKYRNAIKVWQSDLNYIFSL